MHLRGGPFSSQAWRRAERAGWECHPLSITRDAFEAQSLAVHLGLRQDTGDLAYGVASSPSHGIPVVFPGFGQSLPVPDKAPEMTKGITGQDLAKIRIGLCRDQLWEGFSL